MQVLTPARGHTEPVPSIEADREAIAPLIVGRPAPKLGGSFRVASDLLGWLGTALLVLGLIDVAVALFAPDLGNREWELATLITILNGLPRLVLGFGLSLFASLNRRSLETARLLGRLSIGLGIVFVILCGAVLLRNAGPVMAGQPDAVVRLGLRQEIGKALFQGIVMPIVLIMMGRSALHQAVST